MVVVVEMYFPVRKTDCNSALVDMLSSSVVVFLPHLFKDYCSH